MFMILRFTFLSWIEGKGRIKQTCKHLCLLFSTLLPGKEYFSCPVETVIDIRWENGDWESGSFISTIPPQLQRALQFISSRCLSKLGCYQGGLRQNVEVEQWPWETYLPLLYSFTSLRGSPFCSSSELQFPPNRISLQERIWSFSLTTWNKYKSMSYFSEVLVFLAFSGTVG